VDRDPLKQTLVQSTAEMTARTGIATIMEAVETAEEAEVLHQLGIDYGQGFYFLEPLPRPRAGAFQRIGITLSEGSPAGGHEPQGHTPVGELLALLQQLAITPGFGAGVGAVRRRATGAPSAERSYLFPPALEHPVAGSPRLASSSKFNRSNYLACLTGRNPVRSCRLFSAGNEHEWPPFEGGRHGRFVHPAGRSSIGGIADRAQRVRPSKMPL
jgi:hypothetical protein